MFYKNRQDKKNAKSALTFRMPRFFNLPLAGRERMKLRKKVISLPCFRKTGFVGSEGESEMLITFHFLIHVIFQFLHFFLYVKILNFKLKNPLKHNKHDVEHFN